MCANACHSYTSIYFILDCNKNSILFPILIFKDSPIKPKDLQKKLPPKSQSQFFWFLIVKSKKKCLVTITEKNSSMPPCGSFIPPPAASMVNQATSLFPPVSTSGPPTDCLSPLIRHYQKVFESQAFLQAALSSSSSTSSRSAHTKLHCCKFAFCCEKSLICLEGKHNSPI